MARDNDGDDNADAESGASTYRFWMGKDAGDGNEGGTDGGDEPNTESLSRLSAKLEAEKDGRREERFVFCLIILILLNVLFFTYMQNWAGPVVIGAFEALLLIIAAKRWGLDEIVLIIDSFVARFSGKH